MGIRVSPESLDHQLTVSGCDDRRELPFHKMLLAGEFPLTMGGGIGQSRLCMLMIGTAHIGEVAAQAFGTTTPSRPARRRHSAAVSCTSESKTKEAAAMPRLPLSLVQSFS